MPSRRTVGAGGTTRRKHSLGNLRRAHPASGATWNVQVVRGKMSSKCLWHACRALILGLTLMSLGAGMATLGYYADHLSISSEIRGNITVRVKNDVKGFHLNNFSYVGPIVMGFGGFIVVASCVMTFEARDSAAKVVPARLRAGGSSKNATRGTQGSSVSQRRGMGAQYQSTRWDQHFGVFRSSPCDTHQQLQGCSTLAQNQHPQPFDREALTAELVKFSKSLSASARFSPQLRRLIYTGSVPNLSTTQANAHPLAYTTNLSNLLSTNSKMTDPMPMMDQSHMQYCNKRHHRHHHQHHNHIGSQRRLPKQWQQPKQLSSSVRRVRQLRSSGNASTRIICNSSSLIQRATREYSTCALLMPPSSNRVYWQASSFDSSGNLGGALVASGSKDAADSAPTEKRGKRTKRSDTARRHVLARQRPIEHEEARERASPQGHRRSSTISDSSYSGRWTARCASIASRTSSIDSRRIQVDLHSPEILPKSILRSPKRYYSGPSATPSIEKEFRSQLSVCSEPPPPVRQLSGQSSLEPCVPEETIELIEDSNEMALVLDQLSNSLPSKKARPDFLPLGTVATKESSSQQHKEFVPVASLYRSNSSRQFYRPKPAIAKESDDSIFYVRSIERVNRSASGDDKLYDSLKVIDERRSTLLKADSQSSLASAERKLSSFSLKMPEISERENSIDMEEVAMTTAESDTLTTDQTMQMPDSKNNTPSTA